MVKKGKCKISKLFIAISVITVLNWYGSKLDAYSGKEVQSFNESVPVFSLDSSQWVDSVLNSLTLEEKVAQLFMLPVWPEKGVKSVAQLADTVKKYNPGGIIFFQGNPELLVNTNNTLQKVAKTPLLTAIDGEWGLAMRLDKVPSYPRQMMLGAVQDDELIYRYGRRIGEQMNRVGIHVNFAPVADVNNNANNPVINSRSFGEIPLNVARKSSMYMTGMQDMNVMAVAKHFPGHGDTDTDSHKSLPVISHDYQRIDSVELFPFKYLIERGVGGVMVAHLYVPAIDSTFNRATSLSPAAVNGLLKDTLGFEGLAFTDAMNMGGVANHYSKGEADYLAFLAGNDVLLMPRNFAFAVRRITKAVKKGEIEESLVNSRCKKVLMAKYWAGLSKFTEISNTQLHEDLNTPKDDLLIKQISDASITLLQNKNTVLPVKDLSDLRIVTVSVGTSAPNSFTKHIDNYLETEHLYISKNAGRKEFDETLLSLSSYDLVLLSLHGTSLYPGKKYGITANSVRFIDSLLAVKKTIFSYFGNPYGLNRFAHLKQAEGLILAYQDTKFNNRAAVELLFGALPAKGKLPVSINGFKAGFGLDSDTLTRLSYGYPEEVGMSPLVLSAIDTIVENAIQKRAMPGCQILVARHGKVILQKSYGYHTYQQKDSVKNNHVYDLASITKVSATLPLVIQMQANGEMDINQPLSNYLSGLDTTNKADILIKDILLHEARLKAWIPFYISTLECIFPSEDLSSSSISEEYPFQIGNRYYLNKHLKYKEHYFSHGGSLEYPIKIADGLYGTANIYDTIFKRIYASDLRKKRGYKYSDLGFYLLYRTIEEKYDTPFDQIAENRFYKKLGAGRMTYRPTNKFLKDEIVPTENDIIFRRQLVHGYVHDPGAAMLGGVSGHAGLFSNANDLAKLMQMYLNKGTYGGVSFFPDSVFEKFTQCQSCTHNRRGLGFDKPEMNRNLPSPVCESATASGFGHTGFTGTIAWVDPEYDLVYIFLSNRVHPDALNSKLISLNVRTDIQQTIYNAVTVK